MKLLRRVSLVIIASFVFSLAVFAVPGFQETAAPSADKAVKEKKAPVNTEAANLIVSTAPASIVQLNGKSTNGLSTCPARFTAIMVTIDRARPLLQPPADDL